LFSFSEAPYGYLAYLLVRSQCADNMPTFIGIEGQQSWHLYQIGEGMRFAIPLDGQRDILERLERQELPVGLR
jgi:hypothetical protein